MQAYYITQFWKKQGFDCIYNVNIGKILCDIHLTNKPH